MLDFLHMHFNAFVERVGGIEDEPVRGVEALENFERGAVVASDGERTQMRFVIGVDDDGAQTFRAEEKGVHGIDERLSIKELGYGLQRMVELLKTIGKN